MLSHCKGLHQVATIPTSTPNMQQTAGSPQLIPASSSKRWLRKSQELKQKLLVGAENGRPTKPWHGKQNGIAQNLCRGRSVWGGKWSLQKVSGMGGKEERTVLLLQGQDFWGMEGGGRSHTPSFTLGVYQTCKDSGVLLEVHIVDPAKSRQALEPTAEHKPELQCWLHCYCVLLP